MRQVATAQPFLDRMQPALDRTLAITRDRAARGAALAGTTSPHAERLAAIGAVSGEGGR